MTARIWSFFTSSCSWTRISCDPAGDLRSDHRLPLRLEITLGVRSFSASPVVIFWTEADGHFGLGANLVVLPVGHRTRRRRRCPAGSARAARRAAAARRPCGGTPDVLLLDRVGTDRLGSLDLERGELIAKAAPHREPQGLWRFWDSTHGRLVGLRKPCNSISKQDRAVRDGTPGYRHTPSIAGSPGSHDPFMAA